jgi:hypothetical protein
VAADQSVLDVQREINARNAGGIWNLRGIEIKKRYVSARRILVSDAGIRIVGSHIPVITTVHVTIVAAACIRPEPYAHRAGNGAEEEENQECRKQDGAGNFHEEISSRSFK